VLSLDLPGKVMGSQWAIMPAPFWQTCYRKNQPALLSRQIENDSQLLFSSAFSTLSAASNPGRIGIRRSLKIDIFHKKNIPLDISYCFSQV
jgi:hypothetical protein